MYKELDLVALTASIPLDRLFDVPYTSPLRRHGCTEGGLIAGDVGTIVCMYDGGEAFEVEFLQPGGKTVALARVLATQARLATKQDIANYRFR